MRNFIVGSRHADDLVIWTIDGERVEIEPSLAIRRHSPTGFEFGYGGSGPAQSALAIVLHVLGRSRVDDHLWPGGDAERVYQDFKDEFIAPLDNRARVVKFEVDLKAWATEKLTERYAVQA